MVLTAIADTRDEGKVETGASESGEWYYCTLGVRRDAAAEESETRVSSLGRTVETGARTGTFRYEPVQYLLRC